jgi:dienelactone hydrolase
VACRLYGVPGATRAALYVGGIGGDWDTPARGLYPRLGLELRAERIASLRVRFRHPTDLEEAVLDVLAGLAYLESTGVRAAALVGHSFGGAVVLLAAARSPLARAVVTLATQSYGTDAAEELPPGCALLLLHGEDDTVLPPSCSRSVYRIAREPKRLIVYPGADHGLDEVADEVHAAVRGWIVEHLHEEEQP